MKSFLLGLLLFLSVFCSYGLNEKKQIVALRTTAKITIDGNLDEPVWSAAISGKDFVTYSPTIGLPESQRTEIKVVYDNKSVYFGVHLYDAAPDSILRELTKRDEVSNGNVDRFEISLNPYNDGQNLFVFEVSAANVQGDYKQSSSSESSGNGYYDGDYSWNAVWYSQVKITDDGWILEVEIPFAALRFPKQDVQVWGANFQRTVRRTRETTTWNPVDRKFGEESQAGEMIGIQSVKSPLRLELYPFAAGYYEFAPDGNGSSYAAGMDLKYGINDAYTLDMTLIPDFGQRKSDKLVLNLTPYEIQYEENRQFFTEGMELFDKSGLFYSRRIGKEPSAYGEVSSNLRKGETILENPEETKLINVTKISGRNTKKLGVGFLNAMTANTYATLADSTGNKRKVLTDPFTNYNVIVLDQVFGRNSYANFTNTNAITPSTSRMANVSAASVKLRDKNNCFGVSGKFAASMIYDSLSGKPIVGHSINLGAGKYGGAVTADYAFELLTDDYNPNDLGYLKHNNSISHEVYVSHRFMEPFWILNSLSNGLSLEYNMIYDPQRYSEFTMEWMTHLLFRSYADTRISIEYTPFNTHDWYEPRVANRYFIRPPGLMVELGGSSDYRKKVAFDVSFTSYSNKRNNHFEQIDFSPRLRLNDKINLIPAVSYAFDHGDEGYVQNLGNDSLVFGRRNLKTVIASISGSYVFNNKSALSLSLRHYWRQVNYQKFYVLSRDGYLLDFPEYKDNPKFDYTENNLDYNIFSIDLEYSWNFAPGSYLTAVWKNNILNSDRIDESKPSLTYWENLHGTLISPQTNSFSLKVIYYLDYKRVLPSKPD